MDIGFKDIKEIVQQGVSEEEQFVLLRSNEGNFQVIQVGAGSKSFKMDQQGFWLGADSFEDAPFKIDMDGNITVEKGTLSIGSGDNIFKVNAEGDLWIGDSTQADAPFQVNNDGDVTIKAADGDASLIFDSSATQILVNDGTDDRVLIGKF